MNDRVGATHESGGFVSSNSVAFDDVTAFTRIDNGTKAELTNLARSAVKVYRSMGTVE